MLGAVKSVLSGGQILAMDQAASSLPIQHEILRFGYKMRMLSQVPPNKLRQ